MTKQLLYKCLSCGADFWDYQSLALHILASKKGHRKGKKWAAKYINRHVLNKKKTEYNGRVPLTAEQKANKEDTRRVLAGGQRVAEIVCPHCHKPSRVALEVEYVSSPQAWRIQGRLVKMCANCGG